MLNSLYRFTVISALCVYSSWGYAGYASIQNFLENSFAATIVLSDSDVFTVGISDFDPNEFLNTDNENWGTEDSIDNRKKYAVSTLPYTFELSDPDAINQHSVLLRLSGMVTEETLQFAADEPKDDFRQVIVDLYAAYRFRHTFNEHWSFEPGFGVHLLRYENTLDYNSPTGKQVAPYLDNLLFNTTAWANVYEPHFKLKYQAEESWGAGMSLPHGTIFTAMAGAMRTKGTLVIQKGGISLTPSQASTTFLKLAARCSQSIPA